MRMPLDTFTDILWRIAGYVILAGWILMLGIGLGWLVLYAAKFFPH